MTPDSYGAGVAFEATGSVVCDDCGSRLRPETLETLPDHHCGNAQRMNRELLAQVARHELFRDRLNIDHRWATGGDGSTDAVEVGTRELNRLVFAEVIHLPARANATGSVYWELTDTTLVV